jgi:hypothetical protein
MLRQGAPKPTASVRHADRVEELAGLEKQKRQSERVE